MNQFFGISMSSNKHIKNYSSISQSYCLLITQDEFYNILNHYYLSSQVMHVASTQFYQCLWREKRFLLQKPTTTILSVRNRFESGTNEEKILTFYPKTIVFQQFLYSSKSHFCTPLNLNLSNFLTLSLIYYDSWYMI